MLEQDLSITTEKKKDQFVAACAQVLAATKGDETEHELANLIACALYKNDPDNWKHFKNGDEFGTRVFEISELLFPDTITLTMHETANELTSTWCRVKTECERMLSPKLARELADSIQRIVGF